MIEAKLFAAALGLKNPWYVSELDFSARGSEAALVSEANTVPAFGSSML